MLASITPLGERGRNRTFAVTAAAYALGALAGGATLGALCGALGWLLSPSATVAAIGVAVGGIVAFLFDVGPIPLRLPTIRRQVNEDWLTLYRGWVYGAGFGFQLGLGITTIITTAAVYATILFAVLTGSVLGGVLIGSTFGLVRGLAIYAGARVQRPDQLVALHRRFASLAGVADWATVATLGLVGAAAGFSIIMGGS